MLCFVDRASRYIYVMKTNLMHYLSTVDFVNEPLHVSDIFVPHHLELYRKYIQQPGQQSTAKHNTYELLYIYSIPPDDELQIYPKHVEAD